MSFFRRILGCTILLLSPELALSTQPSSQTMENGHLSDNLSSGFTEVYIDDVKVETFDPAPSNIPPMLTNNNLTLFKEFVKINQDLINTEISKSNIDANTLLRISSDDRVVERPYKPYVTLYGGHEFTQYTKRNVSIEHSLIRGLTSRADVLIEVDIPETDEPFRREGIIGEMELDMIGKLIDSQKAKDCRNAIKYISNLRPDLIDQSIAEKFISYKDACDIFDATAYQYGNSSDVINRVVIFNLYDKKNNRKLEAFCTGYLISEKRIVTARHCFYPNNHNFKKPFVITVNDSKSSIISKISLDDSACGALNRSNYVELNKSIQSCDYLYFNIIGTENTQLTENIEHIPRIKELDELVVIGYNYASYYSKRKTNKPNAKWEDGIVVNDGIMCMAIKAVVQSHGSTQCLIHLCQTVAGMSGSPIFKKEDGILKFAGIHIGTSEFSEQDWMRGVHMCNESSNPNVFNGRQANIALNFIH